MVIKPTDSAKANDNAANKKTTHIIRNDLNDAAKEF